MGDLVPTVSVLASAAVALGTTAVTALSSARRERRQTRRDRENELRSVADDAATNLSFVIYLLQFGWDHPDDKESLGKLGEVVGSITNFEDRLAIRLGNMANQVVPYRAAVTSAYAAHDLIRGGADAAAQDAFNEHLKRVADGKTEFREQISRRLSPDS